MNYAIILAGGIGSRFWPLSREKDPKQFLHIASERSMLEETISRLKDLVNKKNIYIATSSAFGEKIRHFAVRNGIPSKNMLFEPLAKNTLAPIGLLSQRIYQIDHNAVIIALPCDHFIKERAKFTKLIKLGLNTAKSNYIVTLGIRPNRAETGYGYIRINSKSLPVRQAGKIQNPNIYKVEKFIEKPSLSRVKKIIRNRNYFWNSGMFIFRADIILAELKKLAPKTYRIISRIKNKNQLLKLWRRLPSLSVDYGLMEKTKRAALVPADCGWVDLGSWQAIFDISKKDKSGNVLRGNCLDLGSKKSIIWSTGKLVATLGLDNIIVVDTKDAVLVCSKDRSQDIKQLVGLLNKKRKSYV